MERKRVEEEKVEKGNGKGGGFKVLGEGDRPQLEYPRVWQYTIIGTDREKMRAAVKECIDNQECEVRDSKQKGKYFSQKFEAYVTSEEERNEFFRRLQSHKDIKFVL
jgi:putative lipoic acid-binding regulatory protein